MVDLHNFKLWLTERNKYSKKTVGNIVSRFKRVCSMVEWEDTKLFLYHLENNREFLQLNISVKSQLKNSVKLYKEFCKDFYCSEAKEGGKLNALSLFSNIGVAEAYLQELGVNVVVANELIERRALLYSEIYPDTHMICGDITDSFIKEQIIKYSLDNNVNVIMATPPCQGMSTAGKQSENDDRNKLIIDVVEIVKRIKPSYVLIENVPMFYNTTISHENSRVKIPDFISNILSDEYDIDCHIIDTKDYGVPQTRERAVLLLTHKNQQKKWKLPQKEDKIFTMKDAIGHLPSLDPFVKDVSKNELYTIFPNFEERKKEGLKISKWHTPPHHVKRQVEAMRHTPTGKTAFDNEVYYPIKENGTPVRGYRNTYKRQNWDTAAYTVTMDNRKISSQNNVHPGKVEYIDEYGNEIYSDARTLTLYELMIIMSIPVNWNIPDSVSEAFLRRIIGEGIPPLFVKKVFQQIL